MEKRIQEGPPIWVESLMTLQEWKDRYKKYPNTSALKEPPIYNPEHYKGGKWRDSKFTTEDMIKFNKGIDILRELLKTKKFQKRPDYGPEKEAVP